MSTNMLSLDKDSAKFLQPFSDEKKEILKHFKEISEDVDLHECVQILDSHNWDLSAAVNYFVTRNTSSKHTTTPLISKGVQCRSSESTSGIDNENMCLSRHEFSDDLSHNKTIGTNRPIIFTQTLNSNSNTADDDSQETIEHYPRQRMEADVINSQEANTSSNNIAFLASRISHQRNQNRIQQPLPEVRLDSPSIQIIQHARVMTYWDWMKHITFAPVYFVYTSVHDAFGIILSLFWRARLPQLIDPVHDVNEFADNFIAKYCPVIMLSDNESISPDSYKPPFYYNSYSEALRMAKTELKFLLVYLHSDRHEDTDAFCREVLTHPSFVSFLRNSELVFWGCNIQSTEGYRVSQALREHTYPFLGIVVLKPFSELLGFYMGHESNISNNRMTLVGRIQGYDQYASAAMGHEIYVNQLKNAIETIMRENEAGLVTARLDRQEREIAQRLRTEQDQEYQESIRLDRERFEAQELAKAAEEARILAEERQIEFMRLLKQRVRDTMPTELCHLIPVNPSGSAFYPSDDRVRILIRMPDGSKLERCFARDSSSKLLFLSVFGLEGSPTNFEIYTNFPKVLIPCELPCLQPPLDLNLDVDCINFWEKSEPTDPPTFRKLGFAKSEMVLVIDQNA